MGLAVRILKVRHATCGDANHGIADLNAVLGFTYVHPNDLDVSLAPDATTSPAHQGTHGDTSYYFFPTADLPLFGPLRTFGVPEPVIDVVEPFFKVIVELGYDRSIRPWKPTPARLIPPLNPVKVAAESRQRDRRGNQQRRRAHRLASAPEHSHSAGPRRSGRGCEAGPLGAGR
jgi:hypothetical protein